VRPRGFSLSRRERVAEGRVRGCRMDDPRGPRNTFGPHLRSPPGHEMVTRVCAPGRRRNLLHLQSLEATPWPWAQGRVVNDGVLFPGPWSRRPTGFGRPGDRSRQVRSGPPSAWISRAPVSHRRPHAEQFLTPPSARPQVSRFGPGRAARPLESAISPAAPPTTCGAPGSVRYA
jgi:hypothetical protein